MAIHCARLSGDRDTAQLDADEVMVWNPQASHNRFDVSRSLQWFSQRHCMTQGTFLYAPDEQRVAVAVGPSPIVPIWY